MGDCQNYRPFLGPLKPRIRPRIIIGTQKGTIILTIPQMQSSQGSLLGFGDVEARAESWSQV